MKNKIGRPEKENLKDYMLRVRMDSNTVNKLDYCCDNLKMQRSELVRELIEQEYIKQKNKS